MSTFKSSLEKRLTLGDQTYLYYDLSALPEAKTLPFALKILLENLIRHLDDKLVTESQVKSFLKNAQQHSGDEMLFQPSRVVMQDYTGVPCVVDLASMRDQMVKLGHDPHIIEPVKPIDLIIDHSIQVDQAGSPESFKANIAHEFERNIERYQFLKWGQSTFKKLRIIPPGKGIIHQINLEYLAEVVREEEGILSFDTLVGTDSHTTMINGLGILGWGVGGIEAESVMLGQPISITIPQVIGMKLAGEAPPGTTATDIVLHLTEKLRAHGVVGKIVEFYGEATQYMSLETRATIANMAPEYGATCGLFGIDSQTLHYLRLTGRNETLIERIEAYAQAQGVFNHDSDQAHYHEVLHFDLSQVEPSVSGPKRPQDRIGLHQMKSTIQNILPQKTQLDDSQYPVQDGSVVLAAITSCTNTSNPSVMIAAGLLARKARALGLTTKHWVKTSFAPGSQVATNYLKAAGLMEDLEALRFHLVAYGCTTCIGNSGPLDPQISSVIHQHNLQVGSVLSGNRNFEGRIHPDIKLNFLMSPPLVVAYALAGTLIMDWKSDPIGQDTQGQDIFLKDIWPTEAEIQDTMKSFVTQKVFLEAYTDILESTEAQWQSIQVTSSSTYPWVADSTYIRQTPIFEKAQKIDISHGIQIEDAYCLAFLGDSITTDHISPAGAIKQDSATSDYLTANHVPAELFNSYGARRGNHEVMMRGTFGNIRLRNRLTPTQEGPFSLHFPDNKPMRLFDAAMQYQSENRPLIILAGKEYGTGSSRDWAAKGSNLLGVRAVIAQSFERIHRSNLVGMGILPLEFINGENADSLGLNGTEIFTIHIPELLPLTQAQVIVQTSDHETFSFSVLVRIDTSHEIAYYESGGILPYVLNTLIP